MVKNTSKTGNITWVININQTDIQLLIADLLQFQKNKLITLTYKK